MGGGGGCCVGNCCVGNCGLCCVLKFGSSECCVGNCAVTGGPGSIDHATKISNELAQMRDKAKKDAKEQEEAIIHEIDDSMSGFLQWIEEINHRKIDGRALGINIDRLKKLNKDMHDDVVGFIGRRLDERLVSTDSELATILGDPNDESRKKNFGKFYDRIRKDAIRALIKEVEEAVEKQSSSIEQEIQIRMKEVQSSMRDELRALEDLQKTQRSQKSDLAIRQVDYMYHADLCDTMSEQLGKAEECGWKS